MIQFFLYKYYIEKKNSVNKFFIIYLIFFKFFGKKYEQIYINIYYDVIIFRFSEVLLK